MYQALWSKAVVWKGTGRHCWKTQIVFISLFSSTSYRVESVIMCTNFCEK